MIKTFSQLSMQDVAQAGGKGASLGEMTRAKFPIPLGFVVLAEAFEKFLDEANVRVEIESELNDVGKDKMHTVEHASERIQDMILRAKMPEDVAREVELRFKNLDARYVAVRSSATAEDSQSAAWAGQLDTYLNTTQETLLKNVQRCWASLFTPRAIFYRMEQGLKESHVSVAVVVQEMIQSEVSGIAFSVHPVTEDRDQIIIEAGWGLGEAVVSGSITPDSYVVSKKNKTILDINVSEQEKMLSLSSPPARGGDVLSESASRRTEGVGENIEKDMPMKNVWIPVLTSKRNEQKLTGKQIMELSEIIIRIEEHYGFPCDIEWAFSKGKFYITQSRPITTLG